MNYRRKAMVSLAMATLLAVGGCAGIPAPTEPVTTSNSPAAASNSATPVVLTDPPVTLRLAVSDGHDVPSEPAVTKFVSDVATASGGNITVVPTFGAGTGTPKDFELSVADLVQRGETDLAVVSSRAWDLAGVTSLQALQAPYLIDNDALALAVAQSDIARRSLDAMGNGVVGLTLWPEDLRHLFSFPSCPKDFRSPAGVSGATMLWQKSGVTADLMKSLGAVEYVGDDREFDAAACKLQGQESGLSQVGATATNDAVGVGNVTLYPKYQVLAANQASFDHLSNGQRQILLDAAAATSADAIARHQTDAVLALAWCAQGGSVVVATHEQRQSFIAAADPIYARLETDPLTKQLIADIRALKSSTPTSEGTVAAACAGDNAFVPAPTSATSDGVGFSGAVPPNGTYRAELTYDGLIAQGATPEWARGNSGVWTWNFVDGKYSYTVRKDEPCYGTYHTVDGKYFHMDVDTDQSTTCLGGDFVWKQEPDGIRLATDISEGTSATDFWDIYRWLDRVWIKIG